jgi:catalase
LKNLGNAPNYYRNTFNGPDVTNRDQHIEHATFESGMAARHDASDDDNYSQPRVFYQVKFKKKKIINIFVYSRKYWMIVVEHI